MEDIRKACKRLEHCWDKYIDAKELMTSVKFDNYLSQLTKEENINIGYGSDTGHYVELRNDIFISEIVRVTDVCRRFEVVKRRFLGEKRISFFTIYVESIASLSDKFHYSFSFRTKDNRADKLNKGDMINLSGPVSVRYYVSESNKFSVYEKERFCMRFSEVS